MSSLQVNVNDVCPRFDSFFPPLESTSRRNELCAYPGTAGRRRSDEVARFLMTLCSTGAIHGPGKGRSWGTQSQETTEKNVMNALSSPLLLFKEHV